MSIGHFLLTHLLADLLVAAVPSRVVTVASLSHTHGDIDFDDMQMEKNYGRYAGYARSKLCNVLFSNELARRTKGLLR
jgi:retinol dehydrogenase-12